MEEFQVVDNCLMVRLPEEVDHYRTSYICEKADRFIVNGNVDHVAFDFGVTKFMDSSGIGLIMGRYKKIKCIGGKIFILHPDKQIKRMIRLAGISNLVEIME